MTTNRSYSIEGVASKTLAFLRVLPVFASGFIIAFVIALGTDVNAQTKGQSSSSISVPYTVEFVGLPSKSLTDQVKAASQLERLKDTPPASVLGLRRRLRADVQRVNEILRSEGYYGARLVTALERPGDESENATDTRVTLTVMSGPRYVFAPPTIRFEAGAANLPPSYDAAIRGLQGKPAQAASVLAAERAAVDALANAGYPFAEALPRQAVVDHARTSINIAMNLNAGPYRNYGRLIFSGLETVNAAYPERLVPWQTGAAFDRSALADYRQTLIDSRLFTSVKVEPWRAEGGRPAADEGEALDVAVTVREGLLRTIGANVSYARDKGFGGGVAWQHRNFLGRAETLDLKADASELNQSVSAGLRKPAFRRADQVLSLGIDLLHEDSDAFEEYSATTRVGLERDMWSHWRGGLGVSLEAAELTDANGTDQSYLIGLPLSLSQDRTDSLLDPKRGYRLALEVTPYFGQFSGTALFTRTSITGSYYYSISDDPRPIVLATRLKVGSVVGESSAAIPANKRFFAGGGGSVRGFGYQLIGALDVNDNPRGGRSVIETGLEARIPVTESISVVPFIDGGLISQDVVPSLSETLRLGAGLGGRYETPVGPLRVDIAVPLNRRRGVDDGFQFYISFGQAF